MRRGYGLLGVGSEVLGASAMGGVVPRAMPLSLLIEKDAPVTLSDASGRIGLTDAGRGWRRR
jgi:hypothetical protein